MFFKKIFYLIQSSKAIKRKFGIIGAINVLLTNLILQILLSVGLFTYQATLLSQIFNAFFGYCSYGKFVFYSPSLLDKKQIMRYFFLMVFLWTTNWLGINLLFFLIKSKNIAALLMVLPLAVLSYIYQKTYIFRK